MFVPLYNVSIQSSINLGDTLLRILAQTWLLARLFIWQSSIISYYAKFCLFCKRICQRETIFNANDFFDPPKFSQVPPIHRCHRLALEAYNFLPGEEIYCSLTDTLQQVITCRIWYQENGIMYVTPFPSFRDGSKCLQKKVQGSYAGACGFQTRILQARKCPIRVKTTAASTSVEQLSLSLHAP